MPPESDALEHVYGARDAAELRAAYDAWAGRYDAETIRDGYRLFGLGAAFVARHVAPGSGTILDAGCGTGLVGEALAILGYDDIEGCDLSPEMAEVARGRGAYSRVFEQELGKPIPEPDGRYAAFTLFGSLGPGHAPPDALDELIRVVRPGGRAIFNTRADTWEEQGLKAKVEGLEAAGHWRLVERSPVFRPFLLAEPNVTAEIFVFEVL